MLTRGCAHEKLLSMVSLSPAVVMCYPCERAVCAGVGVATVLVGREGRLSNLSREEKDYHPSRGDMHAS